MRRYLEVYLLQVVGTNNKFANTIAHSNCLVILNARSNVLFTALCWVGIEIHCVAALQYTIDDAVVSLM